MNTHIEIEIYEDYDDNKSIWVLDENHYLIGKVYCNKEECAEIYGGLGNQYFVSNPKTHTGKVMIALAPFLRSNSMEIFDKRTTTINIHGGKKHGTT